MTDTNVPELECVDPPVGERISQLGRPDLEPDTRALLEAHVDVCAHCRQFVDLDRRIAEVFRGTRQRTFRRRRVTWMRGAAAAAAAAAAVCVFALPPRPTGPSVAIRGDDAARFIRPVEGEVVGTGVLTARWTAVPGADTYQVRLTEVGGTTSWTGSTASTRWEAAGDVALVAGREYRLVLSTVPADLLPPGETSVRFTADTTPGVITYRAAQAQFIAYALIGLALLLAGFSLIYKRKA